jgi:hypothetical protein
MAQASSVQIQKNRKKSNQQELVPLIPYFWIFLVALNLLILIDEMQFANQNWFLAIFLIRLAQTFTAFFAAVAIYFRREVSAEYLSLYLLFALAFGSCFALFEGGESLSRVNINALLYFLLALGFRGAKKDWFQIYLPVASFLLLAPVGLRFLNLANFSNLFFIIGSLILSSFAVFVKNYLIDDSFGHIIEDGEPEMAREFKDENFSEQSGLGFDNYLASSFLAAHKTLTQSEFSAESFYCQDLVDLIHEVVDFEINKHKNLLKTQILFHVPRHIPNNVWVKAEATELKSLTNQLISEAAASLGMQTGVVRVSVQFTLKQMMIFIEDNGRGLTSAALLKLKMKQEAEFEIGEILSPTEMRALLKFWGGDFEMATRMGVGRRVCMSFPMREVTVRAKNSFREFNQLSLSDA